jgi:hypothetical protein
MKSFGADVRVGAAVAAEVYLNGALVAESAEGSMSAHSVALQHEVVPGSNELLIVATGSNVSPTAASRYVTVEDASQFYAEIDLDEDSVRDLGEEYEVTSTPLTDRKWRPAEGIGEMFLPQRLSIHFMAPPDATAPVWLRATPVDAEAIRPAVAAELETLRRLLESRDLQSFQANMRLRNVDMARAYPLNGTAEDRAGRDTAILQQVLNVAGLRFPAPSPSALAIRTFAQGRIIDVRAPDGQPPLRAIPLEGEPLFITVRFAMIDGKLSVIR